MIVLGAEQEISHKNSDGGANNHHEAVAEEEEAKHVVDAAEPDGAHDEVELHKDGTKGQQTNDQHTGNRTKVCRNWRDLAWDLVDAHRRLNLGASETEPGSCN
uniref:Uncharacterized protein n=1 Tax=Photinus pyralis TaxID=7054 RepID=A0A1Y1MF82_PHOPY